MTLLKWQTTVSMESTISTSIEIVSNSARYLHAILVIMASRTCRRGFGSTHEGTEI
jgi:hypothetical protein